MKTIPDPGFAGDDGGADPRLARALSAYGDDRAAEGEVLAALTAARVLVPVVSVLAEEAEAAPGELRREKSTDMALVTLVGRDGRRALPAFTSLSSLAAWRPEARPVPVDGRRVALAAAAEGAEVLVVDVAGPAPYTLEGRRALEALARGQLAMPAYDDPAMRAHIAEVLVAWPAVVEAFVSPAAGFDLRLDVVLDAPPVDEDLRRVGEALRAAPRMPVRGIEVAVAAAGATASAHRVYHRGSRR